jgi:hypothetical protein
MSESINTLEDFAGIGVCQSCAVECRVDDANETIYKLCCEDGPVFDAREVVF